MNSKITKILLPILLIAALGFAAYYFYFGGSLSLPTSFSFSGFTLPSEESPVGSDILLLTSKIERIQINPDVFSTPLFRNLKDFSAGINPESQSRPNPFSPIGVDISANQLPTTIRTPDTTTKSGN